MLDWTLHRDWQGDWVAQDERGFAVAVNPDLGAAFERAVHVAASRGVTMRIHVEPRCEAGGGPTPGTAPAERVEEVAEAMTPPNPSAPARDSVATGERGASEPTRPLADPAAFNHGDSRGILGDDELCKSGEYAGGIGERPVPTGAKQDTPGVRPARTLYDAVRARYEAATKEDEPCQ